MLTAAARADITDTLAAAIGGYTLPCLIDTTVLHEALRPIAARYGLPGITYAKAAIDTIVDAHVTQTTPTRDTPPIP